MTEETIFAAALDQADPAARSAYLDEACAGDAALRRRVEVLLAAHAQAGDFLEQPAAPPTTASTVRLDHSDTPLPPAAAHPDGLPPLQPSTYPGSLGRLGHYEVLGEVGRGAFGIVLKAHDTVLQRVVAIKVLAAELSTSGAARQRFLEEARRGASIRHEHVVAIHAVEESPVPFLVMDYIDGPTLQDKLRQDGPLPPAEVLRIGMQIAEGLAASHRQGLIHRDIKPANILLENGIQAVRITDFGLARAYDDASQSRSGVLAGTPEYMSPEQAEGHALDPRSDLFSLGSTLYAACTGHAPFRAKGALAVLRRVTDDTPRPIREINSDIPPFIEGMIARLMTKKPEDRYASARQVADELAGALAAVQLHGLSALPATLAPAPGPTPAPPTAVPTKPRAHTRRLLLAASLVLLGGTLLTFAALQFKLWDLTPASPEQALAIRQQADALLQKGDREQALRLLEAVLAFQKQHLGAEHLETWRTADTLGGALIGATVELLPYLEKVPGDHARSLQLAERAVAVDPPVGYARHVRAWARYRNGDLQGSRDDLDYSARYDPPWVGHGILYTLLSYHGGDKELARDWNAITTNWSLKSHLLDNAVNAMREEVLALLPPSPQEAGLSDDLLERLAATLPPGMLSAYLHQLCGHLAQAEDDLASALQGTPDKRHPLSQRARLRVRLLRLKEAEQDVRDHEALTVPGTERFYCLNLLAWIHLFQGDEGLARQLLSEMADTTEPYLARDVSRLYSPLTLGPEEKARARALANHSLAPGATDATVPVWWREDLGIVEYRVGTPDRALDLMGRDKPADLYVNRIVVNRIVVATLAMLYQDRGESEKARAYLAASEAGFILDCRHFIQEARRDPVDDWLLAYRFRQFTAHGQAMAAVEHKTPAAARAELMTLLQAAASDPATAVASLTKALEEQPNNLRLTRERGQYWARQRKWREALKDFSLVPFAEPVAMAYALHEVDPPAYRDKYRALSQVLPTSSEPWTSFTLLTALLIDPVPGEDAGGFLTRARALHKGEYGPTQAQVDFVLGMAHLRAGCPKEALAPLEASQKALAATHDAYPYASYALALAKAHQRDEEGVRQQLKEADRRMARALPAKDSQDLGPDWTEAVICDSLRREAEAVLKAPPTKQ